MQLLQVKCPSIFYYLAWQIYCLPHQLTRWKNTKGLRFTLLHRMLEINAKRTTFQKPLLPQGFNNLSRNPQLPEQNNQKHQVSAEPQPPNHQGRPQRPTPRRNRRSPTPHRRRGRPSGPSPRTGRRGNPATPPWAARRRPPRS